MAPFRSILASFNTRRIISLCLLVTCLAAAGCVPVTSANQKLAPTSQGELDTVLMRRTLVIATELDYPPQSQLKLGEPRASNTRCDSSALTANQLTGFDIEVAVEIARRLGVEPCFVTPTWGQVIAGNWSDVWDISVGSMVITPERMDRLYFTQPYASGEAVLFVNQDNTTYTRPADLSGKRIGVCAGCAYESYLYETLVIPGQEIKYEIHDAQVVGYDTDTTALDDLAKGDGVQLDAVLTDPDTGRAAIQNGLPIKALGGPVYHDYVAAALDKQSSSDSVPLALRVTEIIQQMHADGTLSKLSQQYFGGDFSGPAAQFDIDSLEQFR